MESSSPASQDRPSVRAQYLAILSHLHVESQTVFLVLRGGCEGWRGSHFEMSKLLAGAGRFRDSGQDARGPRKVLFEICSLEAGGVR